MDGWKSLKKSTPIKMLNVHVAHFVNGIGAPEREGWVSIGKLNPNGRWSIKHCEGYSHSKPPTHYKLITSPEQK